MDKGPFCWWRFGFLFFFVCDKSHPFQNFIEHHIIDICLIRRLNSQIFQNKKELFYELLCCVFVIHVVRWLLHLWSLWRKGDQILSFLLLPPLSIVIKKLLNRTISLKVFTSFVDSRMEHFLSSHQILIVFVIFFFIPKIIKALKDCRTLSALPSTFTGVNFGLIGDFILPFLKVFAKLLFLFHNFLGVGILVFDKLIEFAFGSIVGLQGRLKGTLITDFALLLFLHFLYLLLLFLLLLCDHISNIFLPFFVFLYLLVFFVFGLLNKLL